MLSPGRWLNIDTPPHHRIGITGGLCLTQSKHLGEPGFREGRSLLSGSPDVSFIGRLSLFPSPAASVSLEEWAELSPPQTGGEARPATVPGFAPLTQ